MNVNIDLEKQYGAHNYLPFSVVIERGRGVYLWDTEGKRYLDMMSAYSAVSHGHCHPELIDVLIAQAQKLTLISRAYHSDQLGELLKLACESLTFDCALPMNTGAEAVETALKAIRKWGYTVKKIPEGKAEIIVCKGNFHGRTLGVISMSTEPQYRAGFSPYLEGFRWVPYGDADALRDAITPHTAGMLIEPIQGEAGIIVPPDGYLRASRTLCDEHNILLVMDEIQTGLGRAGYLLAHHHENIRADAVTIGKALGGGLLPISLFLASRKIMDVFTPGDHGSTFGGNPLAAHVAHEALTILLRDDYAFRSKTLGQHFLTELKKIKHPNIREVRGRGLLIGVEFDPSLSARKICEKMLEKGVLTKDTHGTVIRFAPPLIVTEEEIDEAVRVFREVVESM